MKITNCANFNIFENKSCQLKKFSIDYTQIETTIFKRPKLKNNN